MGHTHLAAFNNWPTLEHQILRFSPDNLHYFLMVHEHMKVPHFGHFWLGVVDSDDEGPCIGSNAWSSSGMTSSIAGVFSRDSNGGGPPSSTVFCAPH